MKKQRRRIIIGDVHGHYDGMIALLEAIAPGKKDEVYFLGDLIDRGPKSAQVVDFVRKSPYKCLLGNHEHMMLNAMP
ncbi:MAG: serine/threonine protein phosphatase, partial [Okeania sp. SIO2H7]|nr:serine/threonine protein phosphatase [Okeania sp. SIO2H7]